MTDEENRRNFAPTRTTGTPPRDGRSGHNGVMTQHPSPDVEALTIRIPMRLQRWGGRKLVMTPDGATAGPRRPARDETIVKALVRAHCWRRKIESG